MKRVLLVPLVLLVLAGCGEQQADLDRFQGEQRAVAEQVEDLQQAGENGDPEEICSAILARQVVDELDAAGTTCADEMDRAISDADDFDLEVLNVDVTGNRATAEVRQGDDGRTATFEFTREGGQWRATSLGSS